MFVCRPAVLASVQLILMSVSERPLHYNKRCGVHYVGPVILMTLTVRASRPAVHAAGMIGWHFTRYIFCRGTLADAGRGGGHSWGMTYSTCIRVYSAPGAF